MDEFFSSLNEIFVDMINDQMEQTLDPLRLTYPDVKNNYKGNK
jgi:hypothetical protein